MGSRTTAATTASTLRGPRCGSSLGPSRASRRAASALSSPWSWRGSEWVIGSRCLATFAVPATDRAQRPSHGGTGARVRRADSMIPDKIGREKVVARRALRQKLHSNRYALNLECPHRE